MTSTNSEVCSCIVLLFLQNNSLLCAINFIFFLLRAYSVVLYPLLVLSTGNFSKTTCFPEAALRDLKACYFCADICLVSSPFCLILLLYS